MKWVMNIRKDIRNCVTCAAYRPTILWQTNLEGCGDHNRQTGDRGHLIYTQNTYEKNPWIVNLEN